MVERLPGKNLDVEVAKTVLGFKVWWDDKAQKWFCCDPKLPDYRVVLPNYSTDVDHAYRVVHELQRQNLVCHFGSTPQGDAIQWRATVFDKDVNNTKYIPSIGQTLPHAICLAVLANREETNKTINVENNKEETKSKLIKFPKKE